MSYYQTTLKKKVIFEGIGLHSGQPVRLIVHPANIDNKIYFLRSDIKNCKPIFCNWQNVIPANLCTRVSNKDNQSVSTIEHLMFSLYAAGVTNAILEIDGPEVPIMDGSAKIFLEKFLDIQVIEQLKEFDQVKISKSFEIISEKKFIKYEPTNKDSLEINYTINYNDQFIRKQNYNLIDAKRNFFEVTNCRTFCHQEDLEKIFSMGLAKGGSLDNAIVISGNKILNQEGLRCRDEFVRHKILDCLGDLYLSGYFICGKITCSQGGHELTTNLIKKIFNNEKNYKIITKDNKSAKKNIKKISPISRIQAVV